MKKILLFAVCLSALTLYGQQLEHPMLDLTVPSGLERNQMYLEIEHKFFRTLTQYSTNDFFSVLNWGSDIKIGLRYMIWGGLEAKIAYISQHREKIVGLSWVFKTPKIGFNSQIDVQFISLLEYAPGSTEQRNFFALLSLESVPFLADRILLAANIAYDNFTGKAGLGFALSARVVGNLCLMADYYPVLNAASGVQGCYCFGIKYNTPGHQFMVRLGNSSEISTKNLMVGTSQRYFYLGFEIMRFFDFNS